MLYEAEGGDSVVMPKNEPILLYHGSYCEVSSPDLSRCSRYKDFGRGFYLTTSREQAERFSRTSLKKAIANGLADESRLYGVVSCFECAETELSGLRIRAFEDADSDWLLCVAGHRKRLNDIIEKYRDYDVIIGKIADDATNAAITAYLSGVYGPLGSEKAAEFCIGMLLPNRLKDQLCFRTEAALACLNFTGSCKIWK